MSPPTISYSEPQIADLASLEAAKLQAQIDSIRNESLVRIQITKEAHKSSEDCFNSEMHWKQKHAKSINEAILNAIRDEAQARLTSEKTLGELKDFWEEEIGNARKEAVEKEWKMRVACIEEESEYGIRREDHESEKRMEREEMESERRIRREDVVVGIGMGSSQQGEGKGTWDHWSTGVTECSGVMAGDEEETLCPVVDNYEHL